MFDSKDFLECFWGDVFTSEWFRLDEFSVFRLQADHAEFYQHHSVAAFLKNYEARRSRAKQSWVVVERTS